MKYKLIVVLVGLTSVVILALSTMSIAAFRTTVGDEILGTNRIFSRYLAASLERKVNRAAKVAESLADTLGSSIASSRQLDNQLVSFRQWSGRIFSDIWYFSEEGICKATVPDAPTALGKHHDELPGLSQPVAELKQTGKTVVVGRFHHARRGQKALLLAPVGKGKAFLSALVDFSDWKTFSQAGKTTGYAALVDEEGNLVSLDPDPAKLRGEPYRISLGGKTYSPGQLTAALPGVEAVADSPGMLSLLAQSSVSSRRELLTVSPVTSLGFHLVIGISEDEAFRGVDRLKQQLLLLTAICWLAAAALGAAFASQLARPLTDLTRHVEKLERGELDQELEYHFNDEIGVLGRAINRMTRTLRRERVMKDVFGVGGESDDG